MKFNLLNEIKNNKALYTVLGLYILFLIPMVVVSFYVLPVADDLFHKGEFLSLLGADFTFAEYINGVIELSNKVYFETQGQYIINYLIYLNPTLINIKLAPIACLLNLFFFLFAAGVLSKYFTKYILKADYKIAIWIWMALSLLTIQFVSPSELFYWYAGFVAYTLSFSIAMVTIGIFIRVYFEKSKRIRYIVLLTLLSFILGGMHYPLLLFVLCATGLTMLLLIITKKREVFFFIPFTVVLLIGAAINILSPGNSNRMVYYDGLSPIKAIYAAVERSIYQMAYVSVYTPILFVFALLCLILFVHFFKMKFSFKYPGVVTILVLLLCATTYVPHYYVVGQYELVPRYAGLVHYITILLFLALLMYWIGWFIKKYDIEKIEKGRTTAVIASLAICLTLSVTLISQAYNYSVMQMNSFRAADDIIHGKVVRYNAEVREIFNMLETAETDEVRIPSELTETNTMHKIVLEPDSWELICLERAFGKTVIPDSNVKFPWDE